MKKKVKRIHIFDKTLQSISDVKIQGATNIAKAGIRAFLLKPNKKAVRQILKTRPTEPLMQNAIRFISKSRNPRLAAQKFLTYLKLSDQKISKHGTNLIKNNMNIYTHCHSSTVINILKYAKKKNKRFVIYTTEVEPLLQGRQTAEDLANANIKVIVFPDMAAEQALKKCDLFLFGADAFTKKGVANKIGTSSLCKLAEDFDIPAYSCGISLKFTNKKLKLEKRPSKEVWQENNKKIEVINPAFDFVDKSLFTGVICEFGILSHKQFIKRASESLKKFF